MAGSDEEEMHINHAVVLRAVQDVFFDRSKAWANAFVSALTAEIDPRGRAKSKPKVTLRLNNHQ